MSRAMLSIATGVLLSVIASVHARADRPALRGFRGLRWGDPPAYLGEAQALPGSNAHTQCFSRSVENLLFGDAPLRAVQYCFHADRLFAVQIDADVDANALVAEFERGYGPPDARSKDGARWGTPDSPVRAELLPAPPPARASLRIVAREYAPRP